MTINKNKNLRKLNLHLCDPSWFVDGELPYIDKVDIQIPSTLVSFSDSFKTKSLDAGVHFFQDDVLYERIWNQPEKYINHLKKFQVVLSPDFSIYRDVPTPLKVWNLYRNRFLSRYWQENGINVIPTIQIGDYAFNRYSLIGIPKNSTLAISTVGSIRSKVLRASLQAGIDYVITKLSPSQIVVYGDNTHFNFHKIQTVSYESFRIPASKCAKP